MSPMIRLNRSETGAVMFIWTALVVTIALTSAIVFVFDGGRIGPLVSFFAWCWIWEPVLLAINDHIYEGGR